MSDFSYIELEVENVDKFAIDYESLSMDDQPEYDI